MLRLENVYKYYRDEKIQITALNDVTLDFPSFGLVMITGPSGCGKSTLLSILALNNQINKGKYFLFGKSVNKIGLRKKAIIKATSIGMMFQNNFLINDLSSVDNIAIASGIAGRSQKESKRLSKVLLEKMNLNHIENRKVNNLSGGEAQRVALARAIVNKPLILLADEPTGALDPTNKVIIMDILKEISKTSLVIMVTHDLDLVNLYADRQIFLSNGKIISDLVKNPLISRNVKPKSFFKSKKWWLKLFSKRKNQSGPLSLLTKCSISFGLICGLLVFGFQANITSITKSASLQMLDSNTIRVSKKYSQEVSGSPLTLVRYQRPESYEIQSLNHLGVKAIEEPSFAALFPEQIPMKMDNNILENVLFTPVWSFKSGALSSLLVEGIPPTDNLINVAINTKASNLIKEQFNVNPIGKYIEIDYEYIDELVSYSNEGIPLLDTFVFIELLFISCIVDELDFFSIPRVYYSIIGARNYLQQKVMLNLSLVSLSEVTWYKRLLNAAPNESITNYERWIFPLNSTSLEKIINISRKETGNPVDLFFSGNYLTRLGLMNQVSQAGVSVAMVFIFLLLSGSALIQGVMVYHWMVENGVDHAILINLGASPKHLRRFFLISSVKGILVTSFGAAIISDLLQKIINEYLGMKWNLDSIILSPFQTINNVPCFGFLLCILIGLVTMLVASIGPLSKFKAVSVNKELTQE